MLSAAATRQQCDVRAIVRALYRHRTTLRLSYSIVVGREVLLVDWNAQRNNYYHDIEFPTRFFDEWKSTDFWLVFRGWSFFCVVKIHQKFPLVKNPLFWWWFKSTWGWVCLRKIQMKRKWGKIMRICEIIRTLFYEYTWYAKLSSHEEMRNILWEDAIKKICCNIFWHEEFMLPWKKMKNIICKKVNFLTKNLIKCNFLP